MEYLSASNISLFHVFFFQWYVGTTSCIFGTINNVNMKASYMKMGLIIVIEIGMEVQTTFDSFYLQFKKFSTWHFISTWNAHENVRERIFINKWKYQMVLHFIIIYGCYCFCRLCYFFFTYFQQFGSNCEADVSAVNLIK